MKVKRPLNWQGVFADCCLCNDMLHIPENRELSLLLLILFILKGSFLRQVDCEIFSWKDKLALSFQQVDDDDDDDKK